MGRYYPINLDVRGRRCLVVGGGEVALRKVRALLEAGAEVRNLGDVRWCAIEDGKPGKGTGRHIAAFVLRGETRQDVDVCLRKSADAEG